MASELSMHLRGKINFQLKGCGNKQEEEITVKGISHSNEVVL
jgi:hypothetical protein